MENREDRRAKGEGPLIVIRKIVNREGLGAVEKGRSPEAGRAEVRERAKGEGRLIVNGKIVNR